MRHSFVAALLCLTVASPMHGQSAADLIRSLRTRSNAAIARHDVNGVVDLLDVQYQITTGDGTLAQDRSTESEAWAKEFARAADMVYIRTPASIEVSSPGGRYAAYWRLVDGTWRIRSELFVTLTCADPGCSE